VRHHGLRLSVLIFLFGLGLITSRAIAQEGVPSQAPAASTAVVHSAGGDTAIVSPDTPVITLDGLCDFGSAIGTTDATRYRMVITRSEFEKLTNASGAYATAAKAQFAAFYVKFSLLACEAQKQGIDKDPGFQRKLEIARIQLLGQMLIQDLQVKSSQFAPGDLEKFFRENPALFEQAVLLRVFIPRTKFKDLPNGVQQPILETAPELKLAADAIYSRLRAGGDFEALQKEALDVANLREEMSVKFEKMSRDRLRRSQQGVFDLRPGEISALFDEGEEGYYIYKVVSKEIPSFESVKSDVETALQKQRMDEWMKNIRDSAQIRMNQEFFGNNPWPKADH
jgi:hypothetical protein